MNSLAGGRAGLPISVSGFVVAEDPSLQARLQRSYHGARRQADVAAARFRAGAQVLAVAASPSNPAIQWLKAQAAAAGAAYRRLVLRTSAVVPSVLGPLHGPLTAAGRHIGALQARLAPLASAGASRAVRAAWNAPPAVKAGVLMLSIIPVGMSALSKQQMEMPQPAAVLRPSASEGQPVDPWRTIAAPMPAYNLESGELGKAAPVYRVRINGANGRQDVMIWGEGGVRPVAPRAGVAGGVIVERRGGTSPSDSLFVETARRAAIVGASITRMSQGLELETKFGLAEIAETEIESLGKGYQCQSFRVVGDYSLLRVNGWFCGAGGKPVTRDTLGCLIDRLDLMAAGNDKELRGWFATAERARKSCGEPRSVTVKRGSEPVNMRAPRAADGLRLKLADG